MSLNVFRYFGIAVFAFDALILLALSVRPSVPVTNTVLVRTTTFLVLSTIVAIGLLMTKRWAAIIFSIGAVMLAILLIDDSVRHINPGIRMIGLSISLLLVLPAAVTKNKWGQFPETNTPLP